MNKMPVFLQTAYEAVQTFPPVNNDTVKVRWHTFVDKVCSENDAVNYQPEKELLYTGTISPGCDLCRSGKWDCFFLTPQCNLNCDFCISPNKQHSTFSGSNIGNEILENLVLYAELGISGVSFSGGEPLLEKDRLLMSLATLKNSMDHIWLYTNGLLLDEGTIHSLAEAGLNEIRFNTAASGYQHPYVLEMMEKASKLFDWITVEIPLISSDESAVLESLPVWQRHGVKTVNLHEFIYDSGSNSEYFPGCRQSITLPDGYSTVIDPSSDDMAFKVFNFYKDQKLQMGINYCSTGGKWRQITARREMFLPMSREPFENYRGDGVLESFYTVTNDQACPIPIHEFESFKITNGDCPLYRLTRMAPLSLKEKQKYWLSFEQIA
jgi:pyruvate formate-lyase activating enzyme-like uncharacterized protein